MVQTRRYYYSLNQYLSTVRELYLLNEQQALATAKIRLDFCQQQEYPTNPPAKESTIWPICQWLMA